MTTTSLRDACVGTSETETVVLLVIETSWFAKPTEEITRVVAADGTVMLKLPSAPVEAPCLDPFTVTVAP